MMKILPLRERQVGRCREIKLKIGTWLQKYFFKVDKKRIIVLLQGRRECPNSDPQAAGTTEVAGNALLLSFRTKKSVKWFQKKKGGRETMIA